MEAIGTNYLQFDSASSLLGFGLAFWSPPPQLYGLGLGEAKEQRTGAVPLGLLVLRALWEGTLVKGLGEVSPRSRPAQTLPPPPEPASCCARTCWDMSPSGLGPGEGMPVSWLLARAGGREEEGSEELGVGQALWSPWGSPGPGPMRCLVPSIFGRDITDMPSQRGSQPTVPMMSPCRVWII